MLFQNKIKNRMQDNKMNNQIQYKHPVWTDHLWKEHLLKEKVNENILDRVRLVVFLNES